MTNLNLNIPLKIYSDIRNKILNKFKNISLDDLIKMLDLYLTNFEYKIVDFQCEYKDTK